MQEKLSYEEVDLLVQAYQDGSDDAGQQLLASYEQYLQKFMNILKHHRFNIGDQTQRRFVRLLVKDENVRKIVAKHWRDSEVVRLALTEAAAKVKRQCRFLEEDDLRSEMAILFLEMADEHNWEASFATYVSKIFPLKLFRLITIEIKTHARLSRELLFDEEDIECSSMDRYRLDEKRAYYIQPTSETCYDQNWVNGIAEPDVFEELTIYERKILKWYYEWRTLKKEKLDEQTYKRRHAALKCTEDDIARRLGCSRKTVNLKRNEAKLKVKANALALHLIKG